MTTTEPETTDADAEVLEDDNPLALVQFARSGLIRLPMSVEYAEDGTVTNVRRARIRRPFFGELKRLQMMLEDLADELADEREQAQVSSLELNEQAEAIDKDTELPPRERVERISTLRKASREAGRNLDRKAEATRFQWWATVFELLSYDGPLGETEQAPAWLADGLLPARVLRHWRSVPLGPG